MAEITNRSTVGMHVSKDGVDMVVLPGCYSLHPDYQRILSTLVESRKMKKVAVVAGMRKLLTILNAILPDRKHCDFLLTFGSPGFAVKGGRIWG